MADITVTLNRPQVEFMRMNKPYKAFVGGFGSGKTWTAGTMFCARAWEYPSVPNAYYAPTYQMINDIFYPTMDEVAVVNGLKTVVRYGVHEIDIYNGRQWRGVIKCRSMEHPDRIAGSKVGFISVDELDLLPTNKAAVAWNKIIARARHIGAPNVVCVTTTPEGFKFTQQQFEEKGGEDYGIVRAPTYENEKNLPKGYIKRLYDTYPEYLIDAYIMGKFVNLKSGTVYRQFDRKKHASTETIGSGDVLHIGQDFNVGNMASVVFVSRADGYHAVDELTKVMDVVDLCRIIHQRYPSHAVQIYPDASGNSRHASDASKTEILILRREGFTVLVKSANPPVKDRVLAMNTAFDKGLLRVNAGKCPKFVEALERQCYDNNSEPDKTSGYDHINDAGGYFVYYRLPVVAPTHGGVLR